jgi:hypothetical protein
VEFSPQLYQAGIISKPEASFKYDLFLVTRLAQLFLLDIKLKPNTTQMTQKITTLIRTSTRLVAFAIIIACVAVGSGCKSKKKAMEAQAAAEKARLEQEAASKKQREEEEARKKKEAEERARLEAEAAEKAKKSDPYMKLEQYFSAIGSANSIASANSSINEALALFASPDTPVLIVISESAGQKDYDRPTTIKDYLNYLKDQKKPADKVGNLQFDGSGKITEVELVKQK